MNKTKITKLIKNNSVMHQDVLSIRRFRSAPSKEVELLHLMSELLEYRGGVRKNIDNFCPRLLACDHSTKVQARAESDYTFAK